MITFLRNPAEFFARHLGHKPKRLYRTLLVTLVSAITIATFTGIAYATDVVYIHDGDETYKYFTTDEDVSMNEILTSRGIELSPQDKADFSGFQNGEATINIHRAFNVTIKADGKTSMATVTGGTVSDALKTAGVSLSDDDLINVSPYENAVSGMEIVVNRVAYQTVTEETAIDFSVEPTPTAALTKGKTVVYQTGQQGKQVATFEQKLVDGVVTDNKLVSTQIVKQPVTQKQYVGTNPKKMDSSIVPSGSYTLDENGVPTSYSRVITGKATAYSSPRYPNVKGASGKLLKPGSVAVDPSIIPYGTLLYIASADGRYVYGYAIAADTGTAMVDGRVLVDCFFETYAQSCRFGAKTVNVYVVS